MKTHTSNFKNNVKLFGRELDSIISYTLNNEDIELGNEDLNSVSPHYESQILKSAMKQLDIDSNVEIPVGTEVNYKFGVKTRSGKNLFNVNGNYTTGNITNTGVITETTLTTFQLLETGFKIGSNSGWRGYISGSIVVKSGEKYTLSLDADKNTFFIGMYAYDNEGDFISQVNILNNTSERQNTFTIPNNTAYVIFAFECRNANEIIEFTNIQIEKGEEATEYEQYGMYEYLDFGNYIVYKSEKQEDTNSYKITCYDKMLYAMKDYENMSITYPITIRDYINTICTHLGLTFANANSTFSNYSKQIENELYLTYDISTQEWNSLGYTFRDVLDELAQVTASTICINNNDELEIRYINNTNDTINEEYLKDINVNFGESTKPINTIVLSRSGGSDKISISYPEDLPDDEKNAIEITDNQIMNFNDRDTYMPDILNRLLGLEYYLNDFSSTGITYYDMCDRYNVQIGEETYSCVMFNDEINVTQGLEELVHTDMPEQSETDYKKTDKTDRRINQTYLIVDKQNQTIESVVSEVGEQNSKISTITQTVNDINSKISDIADITTSAEDTDAQVELLNINQSEPIEIKIRPIGENISCIYSNMNLYPTTQSYPAKTGLKPSSTLTPSSSLVPANGYPAQTIKYPKKRIIRFTNTSTTPNTVIDYELPEDLLYYDAEHYDEFTLNYGDGVSTKVCEVTKRCKYNADGTVGLLATPETHDYTQPPYEYPTINLTDGDYTVSIIGYNSGYIFVRLMAKNIYTTQFYTKSETNSLVSQTATDITAGVNQTLTNYSTTAEMNSAINIKANQITSSVSETYATKDTTNQLSSQITQNANNINLKVSKNEVISEINQSSEQVSINANKINLNGVVTANQNFKILGDGSMEAVNAKISGQVNASTGSISSWTIDTNGINNGTVFLHNDGTSTIYTVADLFVVRGYIMGITGFEFTNQTMIRHYDLNNDGVVDSQDYIILKNLIGLEI